MNNIIKEISEIIDEVYSDNEGMTIDDDVVMADMEDSLSYLIDEKLISDFRISKHANGFNVYFEDSDGNEHLADSRLSDGAKE